jgi:hypothetical protein
MKAYLTASLAVAGLAGLLVACTETARTANNSGDPQYASPSPATGDVVDKARAGAEKAGEKVKEGARGAKDDAKPVAKDVEKKVKEGADKTGQVVDATKQHLDVTAALLADKTVDASHIDVDVDKNTKTLYLRGTVPTAAQKTAAGRIARDKADGFTVHNELTVMPSSKK